MAINLLEYATIFQQELDKKLIAGATSGWMEENAGKVKYNGGNEVKMPIITMDGLGDYDRSNGFAEGAVSLNYKTYTLAQDRGRTFMIDRMDVDETNFVAVVGNVMGEFQSLHVVPEVDAYRYSALATKAINANRYVAGYTPAASTILDAIRDDVAAIQDEVGENVPLVISINALVARILDSSEKIQKQINLVDFKKGEISTQVKAIDDIPLIKVPSSRMKSEYLFKTGGTGQTEGGFEATAGAKNVNWIISARSAPIAVAKTDKIRIFEPDVNQKADAYKMDYRTFHDLWYPENKVNTLMANFKETI